MCDSKWIRFSLDVLQLYRLPVYDENGEKFSAQTIYNHLKKLEQGKEPSDAQATLVGHLTADERQLWAPIYSQLIAGKILFDSSAT